MLLPLIEIAIEIALAREREEEEGNNIGEKEEERGVNVPWYTTAVRYEKTKKPMVPK